MKQLIAPARFATAMAMTLLFVLPLAQAQTQPATDTIATIKARGKLIAGVKYDTPPFGFLDKSNQVVGFDIDLVTKIAESIGVPVNFVSVSSPTRIPMLVSGNVDLVAASMTHTKARDETIDFSITYYTGGQSLLVRKTSPIKGVRDLAGKKVAVQQGTTLEKNLAKAAPQAEIVGFKDYNSAWLALRQGRVDALTGSIDILQGFSKNEKDFHIAGGRFLTLNPVGFEIVQQGFKFIIVKCHCVCRSPRVVLAILPGDEGNRALIDNARFSPPALNRVSPGRAEC